MKFKLLFSYRFLLFILSVLGVYLQLTKHGGFGMMLYYTILSNMLVLSLIHIQMCIRDSYKHDHKNHGAKVVNANNGIKNFRNAGPGVWAKASIGTLWDPATFYYNPSGFYSN